jgi:6-phosphogluconolactonase
VTVNGGRALAVSSYLDGTVEVFPIGNDGSLGPAGDVHRHTGSSVHPVNQAGPHVHSVNPDQAGRFALVADLGADRVAVYESDADGGTLTPRPERDARIAPGSGPRHLSFHPGGQLVYLVNELAATVVAFGYDRVSGALRELQTFSTVTDGYAEYTAAAEIAVHPDGRFLYVTNRSLEPGGEDTIAWFGIDQGSGRLTPLGRVDSGGAVPRTLAIGPDGSRLYVANQRGGNLTTFLIDERTGALTAAGQVITVTAPVSLLIAGELPARAGPAGDKRRYFAVRGDLARCAQPLSMIAHISPARPAHCICNVQVHCAVGC